MKNLILTAAAAFFLLFSMSSFAAPQQATWEHTVHVANPVPNIYDIRIRPTLGFVTGGGVHNMSSAVINGPMYFPQVETLGNMPAGSVAVWYFTLGSNIYFNNPQFAGYVPGTSPHVSNYVQMYGIPYFANGTGFIPDAVSGGSKTIDNAGAPPTGYDNVLKSTGKMFIPNDINLLGTTINMQPVVVVIDFAAGSAFMVYEPAARTVIGDSRALNF